MNLTAGDEVIAMQMASQGESVMIVSEKVLENVHGSTSLQHKTAVEKV